LPALALLWAASTAALLIPGLGAAARTPAIATSLLAASMLVILGLARTLRGERR
jgi:hypothetical protein